MTRPRIAPGQFEAHKSALSDLVHLAGKQRTLSHQVMLCAALLVMKGDGDSRDVVARMIAARREFDRIADALSTGNEDMRIPAPVIDYLWASGCLQHSDYEHMRVFQRRSEILFSAAGPDAVPHIDPGWVLKTSEYVSGPLLEALSNFTFGVRNALNQLIDIEHAEAEANRALVTSATGELKRMSKSVQMLAINAKVESRRLGEAGRPMQFVADEMTKLSKNVREFSFKVSHYIDDQSQG